MLFRLFLLSLTLFAFSAAAAETQIANGKTVLIILPADKHERLSYEGKNIPILNHPTNPKEKIALIPIGYRTAPGEKRIEKTMPSGDSFIALRVVKGHYPHETLHVAQSKVTPDPAQVKRTRKEYRHAMAVYDRFTPQRYWTKPFILPMHSTITSPFGTARLLNGTLKSFHSGTDFKAKVGTPVYAANDGVVVIAKDRFYAGNSVVIDHGQGLYTCYYHLSRIDVKVGDNIARDEQLGLSGSTGRVTGPHLHFAVMLQGLQVDPLQLIRTLNSLFQPAVAANR